MIALVLAVAILALVLAVAVPTTATVTRILDPTTWRDRQIGTLKAVGEDNFKIGIARPRDDPIAAGIRAEGKFKDAMKRVTDGELRAKGLGGTNMDEWYKFSQGIGAPRLVEGVTKRETKVAKFLDKWAPQLLTHVQAMDKLPVDTAQNRKDKMIKNLEGLLALHGKA